MMVIYQMKLVKGQTKKVKINVSATEIVVYDHNPTEKLIVSGTAEDDVEYQLYCTNGSPGVVAEWGTNYGNQKYGINVRALTDLNATIEIWAQDMNENIISDVVKVNVINKSKDNTTYKVNGANDEARVKIKTNEFPYKYIDMGNEIEITDIAYKYKFSTGNKVEIDFTIQYNCKLGGETSADDFTYLKLQLYSEEGDFLGECIAKIPFNKNKATDSTYFDVSNCSDIYQLELYK